MPEGPEEFRPLARSLLSIDPPDHTRIRKLVQPSFTGRGMEAMRAGIQQVVDALLDRAEREAAARGETAPNRRIELIRSFAYPFPVTVISTCSVSRARIASRSGAGRRTCSGSIAGATARWMRRCGKDSATSLPT